MLAALSGFKTQLVCQRRKMSDSKVSRGGSGCCHNDAKTMNSNNQDTGFDEYLFRSDALTVFEQRHPQHAGTAVCRA
jgi:hypothetical protein